MNGCDAGSGDDIMPNNEGNQRMDGKTVRNCNGKEFVETIFAM
jgi:hypothetical protein